MSGIDITSVGTDESPLSLCPHGVPAPLCDHCAHGADDDAHGVADDFSSLEGGDEDGEDYFG